MGSPDSATHRTNQPVRKGRSEVARRDCAGRGGNAGRRTSRGRLESSRGYPRWDCWSWTYAAPSHSCWSRKDPLVEASYLERRPRRSRAWCRNIHWRKDRRSGLWCGSSFRYYSREGRVEARPETHNGSVYLYPQREHRLTAAYDGQHGSGY